MTKRISIIGSGNFACAMAKVIGFNASRLSSIRNEVRMWVYDENVGGEMLSNIINKDHENVKYLPGFVLPKNVVAITDLKKVCEESNILIFALPHQYLSHTLENIQNYIDSPNTTCISLIKGAKFDSNGPTFYSETIKNTLGVQNVAVLMGANIATEVAKDQFVESTLACKNIEIAKSLSEIFITPKFQIQLCQDVSTAELCGALKNVIAMGAGFCDGLGYGSSSKAALIRQGLNEVALLCKLVNPTFQIETLLTQSCGGADMIATCYGGRNRLCSEVFCREILSVRKFGSTYQETSIRWIEIEKRILGGQKLQGLSTSDELFMYISKIPQYHHKFPLISRIYAISRLGAHPETLFDWNS